MRAETWTQEGAPEVAPVRPGEELPWDRLATYVACRLGLDPEMTVLQFPNGSTNLTYLLTFDQGRFVLRRPPFGVIAPGAHDMRREFRVLSRLWSDYDRAPRAYLFCDDHNVIGSDFVVSEYRSGEVIWAALTPSMAALHDAGRRVGFATVDALAELHLVDPAHCGLADLGKPAGFLERQLAGWRKRWDLVATPEHDQVMSRVGAELERTRPASPVTAILHNDFKVDNCQFEPGRPDRVRSVFDWDMATLGDPLVDLGTLLNYWPDADDTDNDRALHVPGMEAIGLPTRAEVVKRYAERNPLDLNAIEWYEAFACWKTNVILQQLYQRYVRGESTDERMASRGDNIGMLARRATRILGVGFGVMGTYGDDVPGAIAAYYRALDRGDTAAAAACFSNHVRYAVPWPGQIETAPRRLIVGRADLAEYFDERGAAAHGHEVTSCVVTGGTCLLEGETRPLAGGRPDSTFAATALLDETGLVRHYVAYQCRPAVPLSDEGCESGLVVDARALVDRYFHALDTGDFESAADCFSDDVVYSHPPYRHTGIDSAEGRITFRGRAALLAGFNARGRRSFGHRILSCELRGSYGLFDGVVEGLPNGDVGGFLSTMTLDGEGRIRRYLSFYCEPAAFVRAVMEFGKDHEESG